MSVEAISWALNLAPVPADRGGQPSSACKFVLVGLANHAAPDGTGAFPSVATLVRYRGLAERTVRTCLDRLAAADVIAPCDPDIVAARIKRADRRPQGWDLNLALVRDDLDDAATATLEHQFPGLGARIAAAAQPDDAGRADGVQRLLPAATGSEVVDKPPDEVQQLHPALGTGCSQRTNGVQPAQPRGAAVAPEPYRESSMEPAAPAPAREIPRAAAAVGGGPIGEFFIALGAGWRFTTAQRAKLTPAVIAALTAGWTPPTLAAFTGANTKVCEIRMRCWPPGSHKLSCPRQRDHRGQPGAANATRPPGCSTSTATHHVRAPAARYRRLLRLPGTVGANLRHPDDSQSEACRPSVPGR